MIKILINSIFGIYVLLIFATNIHAQVDATVFHIEHYSDGSMDLGEIYLDIEWGAAPFTFLWQDDFSTLGFRENLTAGEYCVTVEDAFCCNLGTHCFDIFDCGDVSTLDDLSVFINCTISNDCPVTGSAEFVITGGSGNYSDSSGETLASSIVTMNFSGAGTKMFYVEDACTGESITKCFKVWNGSTNVEHLTNCYYDEQTNDNLIHTTRLGVYPAVYENQTTLEIDLEYDAVVKVNSTSIMGGTVTEIIEDTYLQAGRHYIPINTVEEALGVKVFTLQTECLQIAQPAIKVGP